MPTAVRNPSVDLATGMAFGRSPTVREKPAVAYQCPGKKRLRGDHHPTIKPCDVSVAMPTNLDTTNKPLAAPAMASPVRRDMGKFRTRNCIIAPHRAIAR